MARGRWWWCSIVAVVVGVLGAPRIAAAKGAAGSCTCEDVNDLINRIAMADAAIDRFTDEIAVMKKQTKPPTCYGTAPGASLNNKEALAETVSEFQKIVQDPNLLSATAKNNGVTCEIYDLKAPTPCLTEVLTVHENYHVWRCKTERKDRKLGTVEDRFTGKLLVDYSTEEIAAYRLEIDDIKRRLGDLRPQCRPRDWFGTLTVTEDKITKSTLVTPSANQFDDGTTRTQTETLHRLGGIQAGRKPEIANWGGNQLIVMHQSHSGRTGCTGGAMTPRADTRTTAVRHEEINFSGGSNAMGAVSIDVEDTTYSITFTIPALPGTATNTGYDKTTGCKDESFPVGGSPTKIELPKVDGLIANGTKKPTDKSLSGSQTLPLGSVSTPEMSLQHTVTVSWRLHKVD